MFIMVKVIVVEIFEARILLGQVHYFLADSARCDAKVLKAGDHMYLDLRRCVPKQVEKSVPLHIFSKCMLFQNIKYIHNVCN